MDSRTVKLSTNFGRLQNPQNKNILGPIPNYFTIFTHKICFFHGMTHFGLHFHFNFIAKSIIKKFQLTSSMPRCKACNHLKSSSLTYRGAKSSVVFTVTNTELTLIEAELCTEYFTIVRTIYVLDTYQVENRNTCILNDPLQTYLSLSCLSRVTTALPATLVTSVDWLTPQLLLSMKKQNLLKLFHYIPQNILAKNPGEKMKEMPEARCPITCFLYLGTEMGTLHFIFFFYSQSYVWGI